MSAIRSLSSDIGIVGGLGRMFFLKELGRGLDSMMTGFSYPEVLAYIYRAYRTGDKARARNIFCGASPILRYELQPGVGLALRKEVYRHRGAIRSAFVRHPGTQIDAQRCDGCRAKGAHAVAAGWLCDESVLKLLDLDRLYLSAT